MSFIVQYRSLILASQSPRRKLLLEQMGLTFNTQAVNIDEQPYPHEEPLAYAQRMATEKALRCPVDTDAVIIAGDTIVCINGNILGKPSSKDECYAMLNQLSGSEHLVLSSFCVIDSQCQQHIVRTTKTKVAFKELPSELIKAYAAGGEGLDKAGGYAIQGWASLMIKRIEGSYNAVVGLPIEELYDVLIQQQAIGIAHKEIQC